jgi:hypothetical protein
LKKTENPKKIAKNNPTSEARGKSDRLLLSLAINRIPGRIPAQIVTNANSADAADKVRSRNK